MAIRLLGTHKELERNMRESQVAKMGQCEESIIPLLLHLPTAILGAEVRGVGWGGGEKNKQELLEMRKCFVQRGESLSRSPKSFIL